MIILSYWLREGERTKTVINIASEVNQADTVCYNILNHLKLDIYKLFNTSFSPMYNTGIIHKNIT